MKRKRVGVDVDGVLADLLTPTFRLLKTQFGVDVSPDHMTSWAFGDLVPEAVRGAFWKALGEPRYVHDNLIPYAGAVEGMARLAEVAEVFVVTSYLHAASTWVHERDAWIMEHFNIPRSRMVHTPAKYVFFGAALIDDKPQNIDEWQAEFPEGAGILWAQPYNAGHPARFRTSSWQEAVRIVLEDTPRAT